MMPDETVKNVFLIAGINIGALLVNYANEILGGVSLSLSCLYVGVKLYKESREFWNKNNDPEGRK